MDSCGRLLRRRVNCYLHHRVRPGSRCEVTEDRTHDQSRECLLAHDPSRRVRSSATLRPMQRPWVSPSSIAIG